MSLDGTYSGLQTSVIRFLNRVTDTDITTDVPDFIVIAEAQMHRRFVGRQRQGLPIPRRLIGRSTDNAVVADDEYISVPTDFAGPIEMVLTSADPPLVLDYLDGTNLQPWKGVTITSGQPPKFYALVGTQFQIYPVADTTYTAELTYVKRWPALTTANQATNWILQDHPDVYLYGALVAALEYLLITDARAQGWETKYATAIDDICNADPMPSDKSTLRSETASLTSPWRAGVYNINTDS